MRVSFEACVAGYIVAAILTFGHAASNAPATRVNTFTGVEEVTDSEFRALDGMLAGIMWPLYWSWTAFDWIGGEK